MEAATQKRQLTTGQLPVVLSCCIDVVTYLTRQFRIGNHKLTIETGRYDQTPRVNILCPICASNQIEDESHFFIYCNKYTLFLIYSKK